MEEKKRPATGDDNTTYSIPMYVDGHRAVTFGIWNDDSTDKVMHTPSEMNGVRKEHSESEMERNEKAVLTMTRRFSWVDDTMDRAVCVLID